MRAGDDIENINQLNREAYEIEGIVAKKSSDARELIREMTRAVSEKESELVPPPGEVERRAELDAAAACTAAERARLDGARAEAAALEHRVSALDAEREIVEASAKQQAARRALEVPHAEHALAL